MLCADVNSHNRAIQEKLLYASDNELRQLCFDMGLGIFFFLTFFDFFTPRLNFVGSVIEDVPQGKDRKWYVDWIINYGRSK